MMGFWNSKGCMTTVNCKREGGYNWTKWAAKLERQLGGTDTLICGID